MNQNLLYLAIGALVVIVAVLGYSTYQSHKEPDGVQINPGQQGVEIKNRGVVARGARHTRAHAPHGRSLDDRGHRAITGLDLNRRRG